MAMENLEASRLVKAVGENVWRKANSPDDFKSAALHNGVADGVVIGVDPREADPEHSVLNGGSRGSLYESALNRRILFGMPLKF